MSNNLGSTFMNGHKLAINKHFIFTWTKRSQKKRTRLFDYYFGIIDSTGTAFYKAKRKMCEWVQNIVERNLTVGCQYHRFTRKTFSLVHNRTTIDKEFELCVIHFEVVPRARLELACLSTLVPKTSASTNFATSALTQSCTVPKRIADQLRTKNLPNPANIV